MQETEHKKGKIYYSMGEVAEMFDVNPSLLRYWEQEFDILKPHRNKKGNRLFTPKDVDNIRIIYHLLKERKMKIEVARKYIRDHRGEVDRDAEITERLMGIRALLLEIKQDLSCDGTVVDDEIETDQAGTFAADRGETPLKSGQNRVRKPAAPQSPSDRPPASGQAVGVASHSAGEAEPVDGTGEAPSVSASAGSRPPFEEQVLFDVAVPLELLQGSAAPTDEGFESAKAGFMGGGLLRQDEIEEISAKTEAIEQTLF